VHRDLFIKGHENAKFLVTKRSADCKEIVLMLDMQRDVMRRWLDLLQHWYCNYNNGLLAGKLNAFGMNH
jgi:hypothetical protein